MDGDSLSYEIVVNKMDIDMPVNNYLFPHEYDLSVAPDVTTEDKTRPPVYQLNPVSGDLIWDAPGTEDEYNIAFIIKEWRYFPELDEWIQLGYVTRDMQIIIEECENERPELILPEDTCITAGTLLTETIRADDPDNHPLIISSFGGPYEMLSSPARYSPLPEDSINPQPSPAEIQFNWQTNCSHVRSRPYQITFKATDYPARLEGPSLAEFGTWEVSVVGPAPQGLYAQSISGRRAILSWDEYACEAFAGTMQIWRRVDSYPFEPGHCETGIPVNGGYELINTVPINETSYLDNNNGQGLDYGAKYCYRIVAVYKLPAGGESYVSDEVCITVEEDGDRFGPVITKVSVTETDQENGIIDLQWTSPFKVNTAIFPPPYSYEIFRNNRRDGSGTFSEPIQVTDTFYTDAGLNTTELNNNYSYRIVAYDANDQLIDTSAIASSVRLTAESTIQEIMLSWEANVPWSNNSPRFPYHYIYRDHLDPDDESQLILMDSIEVAMEGFTYADNGHIGQPLMLDESYCYYVTTKGTYGNPEISGPLLNRSNIACIQLKDTLKPCVNIVFDPEILDNKPCEEAVKELACGQKEYTHELRWQVEYPTNEEQACQKDITGFEIWFSQDCKEENFEIIAVTSNTYFLHENLDTFKGCYKIKAIDNSGNTSDFSEVLAFDNCPYYELPNIFTPNQDGSNDTFKAYEFPNEKCPRFVNSVTFKVYNRWGKEIYSSRESNENILINWDGRLQDGTVINTGIYYYIAELTYDMLDQDKSNETMKGWIQVLR